MTSEELIEKLNEVQKNKCETQTLELKAAASGCPKRLYDTLSSFSNQNDGGIIIFGVDENNDYAECGVYDSQDIQKKINEQCLQMEPPVRPLLTVTEKDGKMFVSAEIPGIDLAERPCFYQGQGRLKGSFIRVGDSDEHMTEYEIYSFEAFRKKYQDDIRQIPEVSFSVIDKSLLAHYIEALKDQKERLKYLPDNTLYELMSITRDGQLTMSSIMLFCRYPQAYFPQLCITAVVLPNDEIGQPGEAGERFTDNQRIEGNIPDMLEQAIAFVRKNMRTKTVIRKETGKREDQTDYPIVAIREAIINALVHRDYSIHTAGMPIQILMYPNRIEIRNPGGIYGRIKVDQLGKIQPDTRNPVIATALEVLKITENRYSGIPTIRQAISEYNLPEPIFTDERGSFCVTFTKQDPSTLTNVEEVPSVGTVKTEADFLEFLKTPRSRKEIADYWGVGTIPYAMTTYVKPLIEKGLVTMTIPKTPRSRNQKYVRKPHTIAAN